MPELFHILVVNLSSNQEDYCQNCTTESLSGFLTQILKHDLKSEINFKAKNSLKKTGKKMTKAKIQIQHEYLCGKNLQLLCAKNFLSCKVHPCIS